MRELSIQIVERLGGKDNIVSLNNCMTRLRFVVKDDAKVDRESLKSLNEVLAVIKQDNEIQIIVGLGKVNSLKEDIERIIQEKSSNEYGNRKKSTQGIIGFFAKVFTPLIPVFAGAGLIYGVANIFKALFALNPLLTIFDPNSSTFMYALNVLASSFFTYLNIAVAISAAKVMGGNPYLGLVAGGIISNLGNLQNTEGLFGITIQNGRGGTMAALASGALIAFVEKKVSKKVPNTLRIHIPPLVAILTVGLFTIYVIQPITGLAAETITASLLWLMNNVGPIAYGIIASMFLPLVMTGMHHGLSLVHTTFIEQLGYTPLYSCCSLAGAGQVGATLAILVKCRKEKKIRQACMAGLPAGILGVSEPLIFSVSLPLGTPFITACIGSFLGGCVLGYFPGQGAVSMSISGILGCLINTRPLAYLLSYCVSVIASFVITYVVGVKDKVMEGYGD